MAQGRRSPPSLQPVADQGATLNSHLSSSTTIRRTGEIRDRSAAFCEDQWEEWMQWDGVAESLSPPTPRLSLETRESDQTLSPTGSQTSPAQDLAFFMPQSESQTISKKRKKTLEGVESFKADSAKPNRQSGSQRSHTIIEKRYRTNLNDKIAELRESIPSLRLNQLLDSTDLGALTPAAKLHKATILSKAAEYIQQLEKRNDSLEKENARLRFRKRSSLSENEDKNEFEKVKLHVQNEGASSQEPDSAARGTAHSVQPGCAREGMIRVPESMKRLRPTTPQEHYAGQLKNRSDEGGYFIHEPNSPGQQGANRGKFMGKLVIGSLAGLFIMEGFSEKEKDGHDPHDRGLWALTHPFTTLATHSRRFFQILFPSSLSLDLSSLFKAVLIFSILALALFLYLFNAKPKPLRKPAALPLAAAPSPASPIEVRQKAWLTSIQTVWVPRHKMLPELIALHLEASKYVLRQMIGWSGYAWLTGNTEDDEIARVKAWDIAIDAQLTGGDSEVSKSRLLLTIWASGTLPSTPARLMLKALHIRILLWEASKSGWGVWNLLHKAASWLARHQWVLARKISEMQQPKPARSSTPPSECLPKHLSRLLNLDSDELFTDRIIQRAYNLTWDRPTREDTDDRDLGVDIVVEDCAIRSPLDALSAWASSFTLQQTIHAWFSEDCLTSESHQAQIQLALDIAPPASCAYIRALAAKSVFIDANRHSNIAKLLHEITPPKHARRSDGSKTHHESIFIDSSIPELIRNDVNAIRKCAIAIDSLTQPSRMSRDIYKAVDTLAIIYVNADNLSFLGLAASHQLLRVLAEQAIDKEIAARLNYIRTLLKIWINDDPMERKIPLDARERKMITAALDRVVVNKTYKRRFSATSNDTGYESMSSEMDGLV